MCTITTSGVSDTQSFRRLKRMFLSITEAKQNPILKTISLNIDLIRLTILFLCNQFQNLRKGWISVSEWPVFTMTKVGVFIQCTIPNVCERDVSICCTTTVIMHGSKTYTKCKDFYQKTDISFSFSRIVG